MAFTPKPRSRSRSCAVIRAQLRRGARAVRHAAGVAEVNYIFIGHELPERSERGQAAEARIEESDGSVVHVILPDYAYLAADKAADI